MCVYLCACVDGEEVLLKHGYKQTCACVRIHRLCKFVASFWHNDASKCELTQFFTDEIKEMQLIHIDFINSLITHSILLNWICLKLLNIV